MRGGSVSCGAEQPEMFLRREVGPRGSEGRMVADNRRQIGRVLVVDNHALYREAVARLLSDEPSFGSVVHDAIDEGTPARIRKDPPGVLLLGFEWGDDRPVWLLEKLRAAGVGVPVVALADSLEAVTLQHASQLGLSGVFLRDRESGALIDCIRVVARGEMWFDERYVAMAVRALRERGTAETQFDAGDINLLRELVAGRSNKEIGERLGIAESSTKWRVRRLMHKAGVRSRVELVKLALLRYPGRI